MLQDPGTVEVALDLILISRHLERIGDHATNIAEDAICMVSARTFAATLARVRLILGLVFGPFRGISLGKRASSRHNHPRHPS